MKLLLDTVTLDVGWATRGPNVTSYASLGLMELIYI